MSHFSVAVFTTDGICSVDDLLAPYHVKAIAAVKNDATPYGELSSAIKPDPKWDWYEVGGQWEDMLILKGKQDDALVNTALVADIDFKAMEKRSASELHPYNEVISNPFPSGKYMRKCYPNEKEYIKRLTAFGTYAVVTPDGKWHEPDYEKRWLGIVDMTHRAERKWDVSYYDRFIKPALEKKWHVSIVDCHC